MRYFWTIGLSTLASLLSISNFSSVLANEKSFVHRNDLPINILRKEDTLDGNKQFSRQQSQFTGYVFNGSTGQTVSGATVVFVPEHGRRYVVETNRYGRFSASVPSGFYMVRAHKGQLLYNSGRSGWTISSQPIDLFLTLQP